MFNRLKALAVFMIACICLSTAGVTAAGDIGMLYDVKGTEYEIPVRLISALGGVSVDESGLFRPDSIVTKEQLYNWLVNFDSSFESIYDKEALRSSEPAEIDLLSKGLIKYLGYEPFMQLEKTTVSATAVKIGLFQRTAVKGNLLSRGLMVKMLYNALHINFLEMSGSNTFRVSSRNYLNKKDIYRSSGILKANKFSSITDGNSGTDRNGVIINDLYYDNGDTEAESLLGYNVTFYYRHDEGLTTPLLLLILPDQSKNTVLNIKDFNIKDYNMLSSIYSYSNNGSYLLPDNGRVSIARLSPLVDIIYNGKSNSSVKYDKRYMIPENGEVTLLDNNSDGIYDIVFICSYITYVVGGAADYLDTIYDMHGQQPLVLGGDRKNVILRDTDGEAVAVKNLRSWDIISVMADKEIFDVNGVRCVDSLNSTYFSLILCRDTVSGIVDEIVQSDDLFCVDGDYYKLSKTIYPALNARDMKIPEVGSGTMLMLDLFGRIAAFRADDSQSGWQAGYIIDFSEGKKLGENVKLLMLTQKGIISEMNCADNVIIDEEQKKGRQAVFDTITQRLAIDNIVKYKTNSSGLVKQIDTVYMSVNEDHDSLAMNYSDNITARRYFTDPAAFDVKEGDSHTIGVDENAVVFVAPDAYTSNLEAYSASGISYMANNRSYKFALYNIDKLNRAHIVRIYADSSKDQARKSGDTRPTMIERVSITNEDDEIKYKIYGYRNGAESVDITTAELSVSQLTYSYDDTLVPVSSQEYMNNLKRGDVVIMWTDAKREVFSITKLVDASAPTAGIVYNSENYPSFNTMYYAYLGRAFSLNNGKTTISLAADEIEYDGIAKYPNGVPKDKLVSINMPLSTAIYCYDKTNNKILSIRYGDLSSVITVGYSSAMDLFIGQNYSTVNTVFAYLR